MGQDEWYSKAREVSVPSRLTKERHPEVAEARAFSLLRKRARREAKGAIDSRVFSASLADIEKALKTQDLFRSANQTARALSPIPSHIRPGGRQMYYRHYGDLESIMIYRADQRQGWKHAGNPTRSSVQYVPRSIIGATESTAGSTRQRVYSCEQFTSSVPGLGR